MPYFADLAYLGPASQLQKEYRKLSRILDKYLDHCGYERDETNELDSSSYHHKYSVESPEDTDTDINSDVEMDHVVLEQLDNHTSLSDSDILNDSSFNTHHIEIKKCLQ